MDHEKQREVSSARGPRRRGGGEHPVLGTPRNAQTMRHAGRGCKPRAPSSVRLVESRAGQGRERHSGRRTPVGLFWFDSV